MPLTSSPRPVFSPVRFWTMSSKGYLCLNSTMAMPDQAEPSPSSRIAPITPENYPVPLSPPLPPVSKQIELNRAMSASSKSSLYSLSRSDILYEDEWLIAINKPQGIYCESVLSLVPSILIPALQSDKLSEGFSLLVLIVYLLFFFLLNRCQIQGMSTNFSYL